ncbi:G-type lectin S-receptor-like serine/threonine-protein kinase At5g24080 [Juglans microcarpa x Juglans regia]|uniref:G-type lectin S-receptor-like serine/threonine-protein kinase At5g24080 n=1 Tax=Juglans microcarpa x Juglans regia TaxID=2249226 RepID=UPI001B7F36E9|nr:G-type lectin S-receptor-like serine/threonine-protein kinase At5g24080 [Juglans microcarpa x Juglans regia]
MTRGVMSLPAGLTAVFVLLILLVHQTCGAKDSDHCATSCGNIHNISYPFRLRDQPANCGHRRYNLSCEDNQAVLYLFAGKYYVQEIDYSNQAIRVVDSGIQKDNYSSIPHYFLNDYNFLASHSQYYLSESDPNTSAVAFLMCEKPMNIPGIYLNKSSCFESGVFSSNSPNLTQSKLAFAYVTYGWTKASDIVDESCQVEQIVWTSEQGLLPDHDQRNFSCTDYHNILAYGFQLRWSNFYCTDMCTGKRVPCSDVGPCIGLPKELFWLYKGFHAILRTLYEAIGEKFLPQTDRGDEVRRQIKRDLYFRDRVLSVQLMIILIDFGLYHGAKVILATPFVLAFLIYKWRRRHLSMYNAVEEFLQKHNDLMPIRYSYSEVKKMTKGFKDKLGEGGYGTVFKGTLRSGRHVAVKMLGKSKANGQEFISEVATIGTIHHVNIVQLIGFCVEGSKRALVYEFMSNGSLNKYIFSQEGRILLSFEKMHDIALGVARGIKYLHEGCEMQILHFDIKPHNILLDEDFTPKVSDFGLARLFSTDDSIVSLTAVRGTLGYMAPELCYQNIGRISYKADVYSFGMLLMDMTGRRRNLNTFADHSSETYFPTCVYDQLSNENGIEIEDSTEEEKKMTKKMIIVALWCIQMKPNDRPSMKKVIEMLEEDIECLQIPPKPFLSLSERYIQLDIEESSNQSWSSIQSSESSQYTQLPMQFK